MKRFLGVVLLLVLLSGTEKMQAKVFQSYYGLVKANLHLAMGADVGFVIVDRFAVQVGMLADISRPSGNDADKIAKYKEVLGDKYRLSYTAGPSVKLVDWLWLTVVAGYGEAGVYGYSERLDKYGISGKVKGLEAGIQLRFVMKNCTVGVGYNTIPKGFSLHRPLHDVSFGIGIEL